MNILAWMEINGQAINKARITKIWKAVFGTMNWSTIWRWQETQGAHKRRTAKEQRKVNEGEVGDRGVLKVSYFLSMLSTTGREGLLAMNQTK